MSPTAFQRARAMIDRSEEEIHASAPTKKPIPPLPRLKKPDNDGPVIKKIDASKVSAVKSMITQRSKAMRKIVSMRQS